jgi:hypothetical protein
MPSIVAEKTAGGCGKQAGWRFFGGFLSILSGGGSNSFIRCLLPSAGGREMYTEGTEEPAEITEKTSEDLL